MDDQQADIADGALWSCHGNFGEEPPGDAPRRSSRQGWRRHLRSPFLLRASEGNLHGVLDELPAVPQPQRCLFCSPAGCYGRDQSKQEGLSPAPTQWGRGENASRDAVLLSGKKKHLDFRHPVSATHECPTEGPEAHERGRGQRPHEAGLAGDAELLLSQDSIWSFWLWADQIHRLPGCADHLQQHLGRLAQH